MSANNVRMECFYNPRSNHEYIRMDPRPCNSTAHLCLIGIGILIKIMSDMRKSEERAQKMEDEARRSEEVEKIAQKIADALQKALSDTLREFEQRAMQRSEEKKKEARENLHNIRQDAATLGKKVGDLSESVTVLGQRVDGLRVTIELRESGRCISRKMIFLNGSRPQLVLALSI